MTNSSEKLQFSPLDAFHRANKGKMVPFAGWSMPVHYDGGLKSEHFACRENAGLFDVSHMGQALFQSSLPVDQVVEALSKLFPIDPKTFRAGRSRYSLILADNGGILDDCILSHIGDQVYIVANAARVEHDFAWIRARLPESITLMPLQERALVALQGPKAEEVICRLLPSVAAMSFMEFQVTHWKDERIYVARSGYTGEDGFEISVPSKIAEDFVSKLACDEAVTLCGLGARDSLRLEAGLPLWGSDIDDNTTPLEAGLAFAIPKSRRAGNTYPGAAVINAQFGQPLRKKRVGLISPGRQPIRAHTSLFVSGKQIGEVCSGTLSPSLEKPIAMAYLPPEHAQEGTVITAQVRQNQIEMRVTAMPFVPQRYKR